VAVAVYVTTAIAVASTINVSTVYSYHSKT
jgi:hypothetical protein